MRQLLPISMAALAALISSDARAIDASFPTANTCEYATEAQLFGYVADDHPLYDNTEIPRTVCSATLVANNIFLTAAHCVLHTDRVVAHLGEDIYNPEWEDDVVCTSFPDAEWVLKSNQWVFTGVDLAVCETVTYTTPGIKVTPIMTPGTCENVHIHDSLFGPSGGPYGSPATFIGNGLEEPDGDSPGIKRYAEGTVLFEKYDSTIEALAVYQIQPGWWDPSTAPSGAVLPGDSGGPTLYTMPDATARQIATNTFIALRNLDLGDGNGQVQRAMVLGMGAPRFLKWIEDNAGHFGTPYDIVGCFDFNPSTGTWDYTGGANSHCKLAFSYSPESAAPGANWSNDCSEPPTSDHTGECSGWMPPGPGSLSGAPTTADNIKDFLIQGELATGDGDINFLPDLPLYAGTRGDDTITSSARVASEVFVGVGNDAVFAGAGADEVHGGSGNDLLFGGPGKDVFIPGRGKDYVEGGGGDDLILLRGLCDLENGETLDGGAGYDTVYSPVGAAALAQLGVSLISIEEVKIDHSDAHHFTCVQAEKFPVAEG